MILIKKAPLSASPFCGSLPQKPSHKFLIKSFESFLSRTSIRKGNMDVDLIFKIAAIGILVAVLNQLLIRSGREEQALMTTLAGLVVVLMILLREISALFDLAKALFNF